MGFKMADVLLFIKKNQNCTADQIYSGLKADQNVPIRFWCEKLAGRKNILISGNDFKTQRYSIFSEKPTEKKSRRTRHMSHNSMPYIILSSIKPNVEYTLGQILCRIKRQAKDKVVEIDGKHVFRVLYRLELENKIEVNGDRFSKTNS